MKPSHKFCLALHLYWLACNRDISSKN